MPNGYLISSDITTIADFMEKVRCKNLLPDPVSVIEFSRLLLRQFEFRALKEEELLNALSEYLRVSEGNNPGLDRWDNEGGTTTAGGIGSDGIPLIEGEQPVALRTSQQT